MIGHCAFQQCPVVRFENTHADSAVPQLNTPGIRLTLGDGRAWSVYRPASGFFPYKYDSDTLNLGLYLLRGRGSRLPVLGL